MRVYELQARPELDSLTAAERPAKALGPADVRVRVRAVSLNFRDLAIARGAARRRSPVIPASDGAGEVLEVGAEVRDLSPGDRVMAAFFPTWQDGPLSDFHHANALGLASAQHFGKVVIAI